MPGTYGVPVTRAVSPVPGGGRVPCIGRGPKPVACAPAPKGRGWGGGAGGHLEPCSEPRATPTGYSRGATQLWITHIELGGRGGSRAPDGIPKI